jgi:hypothetical protein
MNSRGGGERNHLAAGGRYIAVIDTVACKMCCIPILVYLEYPPPVIPQLNGRIILAIVREREREVFDMWWSEELCSTLTWWTCDKQGCEDIAGTSWFPWWS